MNLSKRIGRRSFVKATAAVTAMPIASVVDAQGKALAISNSKSRDNPIVEENSKPGTIEWQLRISRYDDPITMAAYPLNRRLRSSSIEGFCSKTSAQRGETIDVMVSMAPAGQFMLDIYRMGYYGGTGGRHMVTLGPFKGTPQPMPMMTIERLRECAWEKSVTLKIPAEWPSGVYLGKLTRTEEFGFQSYVVFVVKEQRRSELLFQCADNTWQAYNKWPGNDSLYDAGTPEVWYQGPQVRVSFDRPYAKYCQEVDAPASVGSGSFLLWEHPMAFWLEQQGYDVTYCSNMDIHLDPGILKTTKVFLSVGHDEYWSHEMFDQVLKARDEGLNVAFFSGNAIFREIICYDSSTTGSPCRAFARKRNFGGEEAKLLGVKSLGTGYGDWIVTKPQHWIYEGLGLKVGDRIPAIIGFEYHGFPVNETIPGLEVVAASDLWPPRGGPLFQDWPQPEPRENEYSLHQRHGAVVYPCNRGNWVFSAGTIYWPEGLACPPGHVPARTTEADTAGSFGVHPWVQRVTANVLNRMIKDSPQAG